MERIEDERLLFFIEHADQIRQWAALEDELQALTDRFLRDMATRWGEQQPDLDNAVLAVSLDGSWPGVQLHRPEWAHQERPLAAVCLEWHTKRVGLDPDTAPHIGVRVTLEADGATDLRQRLREALTEHRREVGGDSNRHWPVLRRVAPDSDDPGDLASFEAKLWNALEQEWLNTATQIDQVLAHEAAPGPSPSQHSE